jgi:hypothetical protein
MSGPPPSEAIWMTDPEKLATPEQIKRFRMLADRVEQFGEYDGCEFDDADEVAALLRAKADKIEAALATVENATQHDHFQTLIKAVEWTDEGDYGPDSIQEAWDEYGGKSDD